MDLERARDQDPENGATSFFLARLKQERGFPADEIRRDLLQATSAPRFETFVTPLVQRIFEKGMSNPQLWLLTNYLISSFPVPDYQGWHLFTDRISTGTDPELAEGAIVLGKRMMEPTQKYGLEREAVYWFALEHQVGLKLFKEGWKEARPDEVPKSEFMKTYQDWIKRPDSVARMSDLLDPVTCNNAWMKKIFERDKADFQRLMRGG